MLAIETKNLTKKYKEKTVVNEMNIKINQGELFALLGTNGAGKTTIFNLISGIYNSDSGKMFLDGRLPS